MKAMRPSVLLHLEKRIVSHHRTLFNRPALYKLLEEVQKYYDSLLYGIAMHFRVLSSIPGLFFRVAEITDILPVSIIGIQKRSRRFRGGSGL